MIFRDVCLCTVQYNKNKRKAKKLKLYFQYIIMFIALAVIRSKQEGILLHTFSVGVWQQ
jgi:hypothetical protein